MTRETLLRIFQENKTTNFCILTSNAEGRGINGVAFNEFYGTRKDNDRVQETTKILGFMEDCVVLEQYKIGGYWQSSNHKIYLPYHVIVSVDFVVDDRRCYPKYLEFMHNLANL